MANALESLSTWLADELEKVEKIVAQPHQIAKIVSAFAAADSSAFANLMDPLLHMVTTSARVSEGMGTSKDFMPKLLDRLSHPKVEVNIS